MTLDPKRAALLVFARMASIDGVLDPSEAAMLRNLASLSSDQEVETLLAEAATIGDEVLYAALDLYADRFFVAFRAYMMAHADAQFSAQERAFYAQLLAKLKLEPADQQAIVEAQAALLEGAEEPPARVLELYRASSFYMDEQS